MTELLSLELGQVKVGKRHREDMGDLESLAESIKSLGLLHPIVVDRHLTLIAGARRLEAFKRFGISGQITAHAITDLVELQDLLQAERDENICRKEFLPSEALALGTALEEIERIEAKERQRAGGATGGAGGKRSQASDDSPEAKTASGDTRDKVAKSVGMGGQTYERVKKIHAAADANPEKYGDLKEGIDIYQKEKGLPPKKRSKKAISINAAVKELSRRQSFENATALAQEICGDKADDVLGLLNSENKSVNRTHLIDALRSMEGRRDRHQDEELRKRTEWLLDHLCNGFEPDGYPYRFEKQRVEKATAILMEMST